MRKCLLLVLCALALSLLMPFSCAFLLSRERGVSSSSRALLKLSRGEGLGRCRPLFLVAESSTTEFLVLATNAAVMSDVAAGDPFWQRIALGHVENGGGSLYNNLCVRMRYAA